MDNRKKHSIRWKKISGKKKAAILVIFLVAIAAVVFQAVRHQITAREITMTAREATEVTVNKGDISNTIVGTGNLEADASIEVKIPAGVVIDGIAVESGDMVEQGDVLAYVNEASVRSTMEEVQSSIDALDEQIQESREESEDASVTSAVEGRVKKLYLAEGEKIEDCMAENGALLLLSMDGYLAVDVQAVNGRMEGDTVTVTRPDGSAVTGSVDSIAGEVCTVLLTDAGVGMGEEVTVTDGNGQSMGTGVTYVHDPLEITGTAGTVSEISVTEDQKVYQGTELYTLDADETSGKYQELEAQREELVTTLQALVSLSQTGTVTATEAGTVEEIQVTEGSTTSSGSTSSGTSSGSTAATAAVAGMSATAGYSGKSGSEAVSSSGPGVMLLSAVSGGDSQTEELPSATSIPTPVVTETPSPTPTPTPTPASDQESSQEKDSSQSTGGFVCEDTDLDTGSNGDGDTQGNEQDTGTDNGGESVWNGEQTSLTVSDSSALTDASGQANSTENTGEGEESSQETETDAQTTEIASSSQTTAFVLASNDTVLLTVSVDELDINSVEQGQEAEITLDALEGETFTGTVTRIGNTASVSGGVAKYSVEITLDKDARMREGMNASATIVIESKEDVLTLPVNALQEKGTEVFVYTGQDENGNLTGEQTVTTGLSDGETVEILEGLSEGDTVYYQRTGSGSSGSGETTRDGFGGGADMPDMGSFGGDMGAGPGEMGGQPGGRG